MLSRLVERIKSDTSIWASDIHGVSHWVRVEENGLMLADVTGADRSIVTYFAYIHDCQRWSEDDDPEHGPRAAVYAKNNRNLIDLNDDQFQKLLKACEDHTYAMPSDHESIDPTLATCWDADRLDLGRVGITPRPELLCTAAARAPSEIEGATQRAVAETVPSLVYEEWVQFTL